MFKYFFILASVIFKYMIAVLHEEFELMIRKILTTIVCISSCLRFGSALADDSIFANEGVTSFQQDNDAWRRQTTQEKLAAPIAQPKQVLAEIKNAIGPVAWDNIENAEKIFCYEVDVRPDDYSGYTLDSMAVTGFCGVIKSEIKEQVLSQLFMNNKNVLFNVREECVIRPRIVLRFVKGIDATDVLLSSPCYSFTVYYPGSVNVFNAKPAAKIIDTLINTLDKNNVDFVSPALLNQLLPVGVPQTKEQRELVSKRPKAIKNWEVKKSEEKTTEKPESQGWNNLNLGF